MPLSLWSKNIGGGVNGEHGVEVKVSGLRVGVSSEMGRDVSHGEGVGGDDGVGEKKD